MYDEHQVLRFENNYKSKDLYLIGNEMKNRIGTGNYDSERTKFNITFKDFEKENLYQDVKYKIERERHEHYNEMSQKDEEIKYYKDVFRKVTRDLDIITKRRPMPSVIMYHLQNLLWLV